MSKNFTIAVTQEENWYVATCIENNVASQGKTWDEALENIKEAIALYYEDENEIPEFSPVFVTSLEVAI
ncbi:type II toxin-antitoxin system HicB family antitoxin [Oscillospiraceae bacterium OttesenSCG-928-F05]|nr:type II toxin-antitoxin system HicB family antitoxin [Oscillospiraceae bacterium OttesenSCG-928-F05]